MESLAGRSSASCCPGGGSGTKGPGGTDVWSVGIGERLVVIGIGVAIGDVTKK